MEGNNKDQNRKKLDRKLKNNRKKINLRDGFFEKFSKIDKSLARLPKKKEKKLIIKIRNEKETF